MSIQIAIIAPTAHLTTLSGYGDTAYFMALAQEVLLDAEYARFFRERSEAGQWVILDNGACELGESVDGEPLLEAFRLVRPQQLILPDKIDDGAGTYELVRAFLAKYATQLGGTRLTAVAHGRDYTDWLSSWRQLTSLPQVGAMAIGKTAPAFPDARPDYARIAALEHLVSKGLLPEHMTVHVLGSADAVHLELAQLRQFGFVTGLDTSAPVVHGASGIRFEEGTAYRKLATHLPMSAQLSPDQLEDCMYNIDIMRRAAGIKV